jgi:hypothetical protein
MPSSCISRSEITKNSASVVTHKESNKAKQVYLVKKSKIKIKRKHYNSRHQMATKVLIEFFNLFMK